jgi:hypothetical protein
MESETKRKWDADSPVERNPQRVGQEGVEANIPRVVSTIKRLHLEQRSYFKRRRLILIQGVNSNLNRQLAPVWGRLGMDQGFLKEPETALEHLPLLKSNLQRDAESYLRCLIEMWCRTSRWPSSGRTSLLRKTSKTFKVRYTAECRWSQT